MTEESRDILADRTTELSGSSAPSSREDITFENGRMLSFLSNSPATRPVYIRVDGKLFTLTEVRDRVTNCIELVAGLEITEELDRAIVWTANGVPPTRPSTVKTMTADQQPDSSTN